MAWQALARYRDAASSTFETVGFARVSMVAVVSELIGADSDELTIQIIENDKRLWSVR